MHKHLQAPVCLSANAFNWFISVSLGIEIMFRCPQAAGPRSQSNRNLACEVPWCCLTVSKHNVCMLATFDFVCSTDAVRKMRAVVRKYQWLNIYFALIVYGMMISRARAFTIYDFDFSRSLAGVCYRWCKRFHTIRFYLQFAYIMGVELLGVCRCGSVASVWGKRIHLRITISCFALHSQRVAVRICDRNR